MKVITKDNYYYRVDNEEAEQKVKHQGYAYCSKQKWKLVNKAKSKNAPESQELELEKVVTKKNYQKPKRS